MKQLLFLAAVCLLASSAAAVTYVEDFEYADPETFGFTSPDGIFYHQTVTQPSSPSDNYVLDDLSSYLATPRDGQSMLIWDGYDKLTFNLQPGQYVESVSLDYFNIDGTAQISVLGTEFNYTWNPLPGASIWESIDTSGIDFGQITEVRFGSLTGESAFDNITINVVTPEPATLALLGLGGLILRKRSRC